MNVSLHIVQLSDKGVQCATQSSTGWLFWLPRGRPAEWAEPPQPGAKINVTLPTWLARKHKQLTRVQGQYAIAFHQPPDLDPVKANAEGSLPMTNYPEDIGEGVLFKNRDKTKPSQPDYFGKAEVKGVKLRVSAWLKDSKKNPGQKYMSLSFRLDDTQEQPGQQRRPAGGQSFADTDIPFEMEWR